MSIDHHLKTSCHTKYAQLYYEKIFSLAWSGVHDKTGSFQQRSQTEKISKNLGNKKKDGWLVGSHSRLFKHIV
jgi:hypothetical protein